VKNAIIVNDRGEAFVRWHSHCSLSESGFETYHSVPFFAKEKVLHYEECSLWPTEAPKDRPWRLNRPYVFASARSAERAMRRMLCFGRLAVVS
jgi:hypothetical protein